jgi:serine protease DegQ
MQSKRWTLRKSWGITAQLLAVVFLGTLADEALVPERHLWAAPTASPQGGAAAPAVPPTASISFSAAAEKAMPSVVNIFTSKELPGGRGLEDPLLRRFFGEQRATSLGSGVIVSRDGYVLTNNHVVEGADEIAVMLPGNRNIAAQIVGSDPDTDLAVLKVKANNLTPITFGDSDRIKIGDVVLAIGDPFGVGQTVTMGIVSATGRNRMGINPIENFIQTDAAINPGNSGGALVDTSGNLVGINSAIVSPSGGSLGIGFAIPVSMARQVMDQIIKTGRVARGWLGVEIQDITPEIAAYLKLKRPGGAVVTSVVQGGPADKGGMQPGDVVLSLGGKPVDDTATLISETAKLSPGQRMELEVLRQGKELRLSVIAGTRPASRVRN